MSPINEIEDVHKANSKLRPWRRISSMLPLFACGSMQCDSRVGRLSCNLRRQTGGVSRVPA